MKHTAQKIIITAAVLLVMLCGSLLTVAIYDNSYVASKEIARIQSQLNTLALIIPELEVEEVNSSQWFRQNLENHVELFQAALSGLVKNSKYTGPCVFDNGMVVEIKDDQIIYPDGLPEGVLTDTFRKEAEDLLIHGKVLSFEDDSDEEAVFLSAGQILDNVYYIDWTSLGDFYKYIDAHSRTQEALDTAASACGGHLMVVLHGENMEEPPVVTACSSGISDPDDPDLFRKLNEFSLDKSTGISLEGVSYVPVWASIDASRDLVFLLPSVSIFDQGVRRALFVVFVMALLLILLIVYLASIRKFLKKNKLSEFQIDSYRPKTVRKKVIRAGAICAIVMFLGSCFLCAIGTLQTETQSGQERLANMLELLKDEENLSETKSLREEEQWFVHYGDILAELITADPQLASKEKLQEFCDILGIDYIMLFDAEGKELVCNDSYINFELGKGQGENAEDFLRLLKGVHSIVHPASTDPLTELTEQIIGVTMVDNSGEYGALIMALPPELISRSQGRLSGISRLEYLIDLEQGGNVYFSLDAETGIILKASETPLIDTPAENYGIEEAARKSGYMGFIVISGIRYYTVSSGLGSEIYYYAVPVSNIFGGILPYGLIVTGCFMLMYAVAAFIMLIGYNENAYLSQLAQTAEEWEEDLADTEDLQDQAIQQVKDTKMAFGQKWKDQTPEMKVRSLFQGMFLLFILAVVVYVILNMNQMRASGSSLISFILFGDWMRGLNLFAICSILMMIIVIYAIVAVLKWILRLLTGFLGSRAETICRLLHSVIHYIAVLAGLYFTLEYLGFELSTILTGLGIVGVAISFGAKDMIADIFAGISIVFEGAFQVGEMIQLRNFQGRVESIGIRMTKIVSRDNSLMIINNKDLKEVINLSRLTSWVTVNIRISVSQSLPYVREVLEKELPSIGEKSELILKGPVFLGVRETSGTTGTISVTAECKSKDFGKTQAYLTEEVVELLKRKEIVLQ